MKTKPGDQIGRQGVYIRLDDLQNPLIGNKEVMCTGGMVACKWKIYLNLLFLLNEKMTIAFRFSLDFVKYFFA